MVLQNNPKCQGFHRLAEADNEDLKNEVKKSYKKLKSSLPEFAFDNETVTAYGNFAFIEEFKRYINFQKETAQTLNLDRGHNTVYSTEVIIDFMVDNHIVGNHRFYHYEKLAEDPGHERIKDKDQFPHESTCRKLLGHMDQENIDELKELNSKILNKKAGHDGSLNVWLSIDDTVSELFGDQEKGALGYNPKRTGDKSYKLPVTFIDDNNDLLDLSLKPGSEKCDDLDEYLKKALDYLPENYNIKGVLVDRNYFSEDNCKRLEKRSLFYLMKAKIYPSLKRKVHAIPEEDWEYIGGNFWVSEKVCRLDSWDEKRRFIFIRKEETKDKENQAQQYLAEDMKTHFEYQAIVTNIPGKMLSAEACMQKYNQRATVENRIEEIKNGFAVDQNSQLQFFKNYADILIKALAYNIFNWFKQALLPHELAKASIRTVRRLFLNVPGNVVKRGGRKLTINLPDIKRLKNIINRVKDRLYMFALRRTYTPT